MADSDYYLVHDSASTNTTPGSIVDVTIDTTPICSNMTDAEFRKKVLSLRDDAVKIVEKRLHELTVWQVSAQDRVKTWFGVADEGTRQTLITGLNALLPVMRGLKAENFVRADPARDRSLGCVPNMKNLGEVAHVCGPDTATHTISIDPAFCTMPDISAATLSSKQQTIVHECTHFLDTFGSVDYHNTYGQFLGKRLAQDEPSMAIKNADNLAWYIVCIG
jgi:peptidyl-Lys metalloendopeptidase